MASKIQANRPLDPEPFGDSEQGSTAATRVRRGCPAALSVILAISLLAALNQTASAAAQTRSASQIGLSAAQARWLGERVFANECASKLACLSSWNAGEDFPSLGIGHFIWYQRGQDEAFEETFPSLLSFLANKGIELPSWISATIHRPSSNDRNEGGFSADSSDSLLFADSPWESREAFLADFDGPRLQSLRELLARTQAEQAEFIIQRFSKSSDAVVAAAPLKERAALETRLAALTQASPPAGLYALIDYVHFKGTGLKATERYAGEGWGLLQVLRGMDDRLPALEGFVESAQARLTIRVANAPPGRREQRWLQGWLNRLETYSQAASGEL